MAAVRVLVVLLVSLLVARVGTVAHPHRDVARGGALPGALGVLRRRLRDVRDHAGLLEERVEALDAGRAAATAAV